MIPSAVDLNFNPCLTPISILFPVSGFKFELGSTLIFPVEVVVNNSAILGYLNPSP